jgi:hypothetical protein
VIVNLTAPSVYAVAFASYGAAEADVVLAHAADRNALYKNGVRWGNTTDPVTGDSCSPFGQQLTSNGYLYYKHYSAQGTRPDAATNAAIGKLLNRAGDG